MHREVHDADMEALACRMQRRETAGAHAQQGREHGERAARGDSVLEPAEGHPHRGGNEHRGERRDRECEQRRAAPDAEPGDEPVDELVLRDLIPGVPDRARPLEARDGDEGRQEDGEPEQQPRERDREEEGGPGEAHTDAVENDIGG